MTRILATAAAFAVALTAIPALPASSSSAQLAMTLNVPVVCRLDTIEQTADGALVRQMCNSSHGFSVVAYHDPGAGQVVFDYNGVVTTGDATGVTEVYASAGPANVDARVSVTGADMATVRLVITPNR